MKRFFIRLIMFALVIEGAFAQKETYKELFTRAKSYESQQKWVNALASYYDAMVLEPNEKAEEAFNAYTKLADTIKGGRPGYGEFDDFDIYDGWMAIAEEWEVYWKKNCPVYFEYEKFFLKNFDMEKRTGSYEVSLASSFTSKYDELYSVIIEGWKKAYRSEWKGCNKDFLKLTDSPESRKYTLSASLVDAQGNVIYSLFENDQSGLVGKEYVWIWSEDDVPREQMKKLNAVRLKLNNISWIVNGQKSSYDLAKVEILGLDENYASNIVSYFKGFLASREMVYVEGGTFQMGSNEDDGSKPIHNVTVSTFYICKTEVTQAQWKYVMGNNPSSCIGESKPVDKVSWYDAIVYCNRLSILQRKTPVYSVKGTTNPDLWGYRPSIGNSIREPIEMNMKANGYRLPTEAEWEYAARGGKKSRGYKFSGSNDFKTVARYETFWCGSRCDVATKAPNELDLYDMSGNQGEWCWDWYDPNYYSNSPLTNPTGPSFGSERVKRYGGHDEEGYWIRYVDVRHCSSPEDFSGVFRVVCSISDH